MEHYIEVHIAVSLLFRSSSDAPPPVRSLNMFFSHRQLH